LAPPPSPPRRQVRRLRPVVVAEFSEDDALDLLQRDHGYGCRELLPAHDTWALPTRGWGAGRSGGARARACAPARCDRDAARCAADVLETRRRDAT